jgi:LysR family transcriptional regulator, carnitine catabolism transcriptional activator
MDEAKLRYFLSVVDEGSVTKAARRVNVAQPSLSQAIRALERELGVDLFVRAGRGVRLSGAGETLVGPARQVLRAMDEVRDAVAGIVELRSGTVTLAALATLAVDPIASLIGRFRERFPGVEVRVLEPESADAVSSSVRDGTCELGAAHLPLPIGGLVTHPLGEQELLFVLPPKADSANERPLRAAELAKTPFVVAPAGTSTRLLLEQALAEVEVLPQIAVETAAREAIVPLVLAGAGAALLPAPLARDAQRRGAVVRPARPAITRRVGLVHRAGVLSHAATAFLGEAMSFEVGPAGADASSSRGHRRERAGGELEHPV